MKFKDMPYERPDLDEIKAKIGACARELAEAVDYAHAEQALRDHDTLRRHIDTLFNIAYIRHDLDNFDAFYAAESDFWNAANPEIGLADDAFNEALLTSPFRPELEEAFGRVLFDRLEQQRRVVSPEVVGDLKQEAELGSRYMALVASVEIGFDDESYTYSQFASLKGVSDDARRNAAWRAEGLSLAARAREFDDIYGELVELRTKMAHKLGYEDFVAMAYDVRGRLSYGHDEVVRFRDIVRTHVTPLTERLYRLQAERTGCAFPLSNADAGLTFRSGNPVPVGSTEDLLSAADRLYRELSPETDACFSLMRREGLLDLLPTKGKSAGGYMSVLPEYEVPFIFANCNGTRRDIDTLTHEVGHAFAYYLNTQRVPYDLSMPTSEACEVHAMSMEFIAWPWISGFVGPDTRKYKWSHLLGALEIICRGSMADHFQEEVYAHPEMSPEERCACWKRMMNSYEPWIDTECAIPFYGEGRSWQPQLHFFTIPFYYVDYSIAQAVALEVWAQSLDDPRGAWERYLAYTRLGGTEAFTGLVRDAGFESPFDDACLAGICEKARTWFSSCDLTGIE